MWGSFRHVEFLQESANPNPNSIFCVCSGGMKCPECEFVYGTKWELNRHLKSKHSLKVVEAVWEVNSIHINRPD